MSGLGCLRVGLAAMVAVGVAACTPVVKHATPLDQAAQLDTFGAAYVLQPMDSVEVQFLVNPQYNTIAQIRPDGILVLPQQKVDTKGLTPEQLSDRIRDGYVQAGLMKDPIVTVQIRDYANMRVFVGGEVGVPAVLKLTGRTTVMQAIMAAGGFRTTGRTSEVVVVRQGAGGRHYVFAVDTDDIVSGKKAANDIQLSPLDIVVVPPTDVASLDRWVDQYIRSALPISTSGSLSAYYDYGATKVP